MPASTYRWLPEVARVGGYSINVNLVAHCRVFGSALGGAIGAVPPCLRRPEKVIEAKLERVMKTPG